MSKEEIVCCTVVCDRPLDAEYWDAQYRAGETGWDLGMANPALAAFFDSIENKNLRILIPGAGNAYEAAYLLERGFSNISIVDIAPSLIEALRKRFEGQSGINLYCGDFFAHQGEYDLIIEQTFFCALPPQKRAHYMVHMHKLLASGGKLAGLWFNREFESGPPFGGNIEEYKSLFIGAFHAEKLNLAPESVLPRKDTEVWMTWSKLSDRQPVLYQIQGITCSGCMGSIQSEMLKVPGVASVHFNSAFSEVAVVWSAAPDFPALQKAAAIEAKYILTE
jgi:methyl halide transferase